MKKDIANYLGGLFPDLKGVDFQALKKIGKRNILAMMSALEAQVRQSYRKKAESRALIGKIGQKPEDKRDTILLTQLLAEVGSNDLLCSDLKLAISALTKCLKGTLPNVPLFPILREKPHFPVGSDVMVCVDSLMWDEKLLKKGWVSAKVLSYSWAKDTKAIWVITNEPFCTGQSKDNLQGRYCWFATDEPFILSRAEYFALKGMNVLEANDILPVFISNCVPSIREQTEMEGAFKEALAAPFDEGMTNELLTESDEVLTQNALRLVNVAGKSQYYADLIVYAKGKKYV